MCKNCLINSLCNIPGCPESLWQSMARCYIVHNEKERNIRKKSGNDEENEHRTNSKNQNKTRTHKKNNNKRQHKTGRCPIGHWVCYTNGWNNKRNTRKGTGDKNGKWRNPSKLAMDGRCSTNPWRNKTTTRNHGYDRRPTMLPSLTT